MANTPLLGSFSDVGGSSLMFRNAIINGNFDIWQRGGGNTTTNGYGNDDCWFNGHSGSTKTCSRQSFALGQSDVPNNPSYFSRTVVSSVTGVSNFVNKQNIIEYVSTFAGQTVTLSFWAKADSAKNIAVTLSQYFGSGGSPSSTVSAIGATLCALTTTWRKYTVTTTLPSISGKVLGTNSNDYLAVVFWFDAGSSVNVGGVGLGQQSGTFDIAQVQLEAGTIASGFERRPYHVELNLCQRYYELWSLQPYSTIGVGQAWTSTLAFFYIKWNVQKRAIPYLEKTTNGFDIQTTSVTKTAVDIDEFYEPNLNSGRIRVTSSGFTPGQSALIYSGASGGFISFNSTL